jgi:tetratricopeptide (TPR) repeat protein
MAVQVTEIIKMKKLKAAIIFFIAVIFFACTSTGEVLVNSQRNQTEKNLTAIEEAIIPLEAIGANEARNRTKEITSARGLVVQMEKDESADADYSGRLMAWSGRLAILEGRYSEAVRLYRQSVSVSPGTIPAVVLSVRLEGDPVKKLEIIEKELALLNQRSLGIGELNIEKGYALAELKRFSEAVGAFDAAFSSGINKVYKDSYGKERDRAWELRNASGVNAGSLSLLGRETITWNDCISLAKNETQLLRFISGGRSLTDAELFNRLVDRAFIPFIQDVTVSQWPLAKPKPDETITRAGAAFFIWHLYAEARADRGMLSRYSARYATGSNPRSPIADTPALSPFFDSILGCVETELLSLPDGRNFRPTQSIRGAELLTILKKIDN